MNTELKEMSMADLEQISGAGPNHLQAFSDFFSWIGCGFSHHYAPTGKTRHGHDFIFEVTFYEVVCNDCGHYSWKRMYNNEAYVQGPKIDPRAMPPKQQ